MNLLINGWQHPLAQTFNIEGHVVSNSWNIASRIVAVATKRITAEPLLLGQTTAFLIKNNLVDRNESINNYRDATNYIRLIDQTQAKLEELNR